MEWTIFPPGLRRVATSGENWGESILAVFEPAPEIVLTSYGCSLAFARTSLDIPQTGLYRLLCKSLHLLILFLTIPKKL